MYHTRLDIANRALQHLGVPRITDFATDNRRQAREAGFAIDKLRLAELQRSVWTFATRRCAMRPITFPAAFKIVFDDFNPVTTYSYGDISLGYDNSLWISRYDTNSFDPSQPSSEGINPRWIKYFGQLIARAHDTSTHFLPGDMVVASSTVFICTNPNTNVPPPNTTYWHPVLGATAALVPPDLGFAPAGYEPDALTRRNWFMLPANYLRMAPQDPKMPAGARLNTTAEMQFHDWEIEEPYLFTSSADPFVLRFVSDTADISNMHPLFCEVWAARLAAALAQPLTQSPAKAAAAMAEYQQYMAMAVAISAVSTGTTEGEIGSQAQGR